MTAAPPTKCQPEGAPVPQDVIDDLMGVDDDCWQCGGDGFYCVCEDEIGCIDPDAGCDLCERRCEVCNPRKKTP